MLTLTSPVEIWAHRLPAGAKLLALAAFTLLLFRLQSPWALGLAGAAVAGVTLGGGAVFARRALAMLRPLWPFVLIVGLWHLYLRDPGGVPVLIRMFAAVAAANFVTMTTRLSDMMAVIETLARPLAVVGLSPRIVALSMALVIRFIPVMVQRATQISESWRARSPRKTGWRVLVPVTLAALDDAESAAEALRARGGSG